MNAALILGGGGQDGFYLRQFLSREGEEVVIGVRPGSTIDHWPRQREEPRLVEVDVTDLSSLNRVMQDISPTTVYQLAGFSSVGASWEQPYKAISVNAMGTLNTLEAVRRLQDEAGCEIRVVHASSGEIFAGHGSVTCDEEVGMSPVSPYGVGKAAAMDLVRHFRECFSVDVRAAILFSHESPMRTGNFVSRRISDQVAALSVGRTSTIRIGNLSARRDWGFAGDHARAMALLGRYPHPEDFVIATGEAHSVADWIRYACELVGRADWEEIVHQDDALIRPEDPPILVGDSSRAQSHLGWAPTVNFKSLVELMLNDSIEKLSRSLP